MLNNIINVHPWNQNSVVNVPETYCYYCIDNNGDEIKITNQKVVLTTDGTANPYCSSFLDIPSTIVETYHSTNEPKIGGDAFDFRLGTIDSDFCGSSGDYTCSVHLWPDCSTPIDSNHLYVSNRDVFMKRDVPTGFSYDVCYKCTGNSNGVTLTTTEAWSVTL